MKAPSVFRSNKGSSQISFSSQESQDQVLVFILFFCLSIGLLLLFLPHQNVDGNPVPALIFPAHPSLYQALVISVMFSFAGASAALMIGKKGRLRRFYFGLSVLSVASTLSIIAFALFLEIYRLLVSWGFMLCELNEDGANLFFVFQVFRKVCAPPPEELS